MYFLWGFSEIKRIFKAKIWIANSQENRNKNVTSYCLWECYIEDLYDIYYTINYVNHVIIWFGVISVICLELNLALRENLGTIMT